MSSPASLSVAAGGAPIATHYGSGAAKGLAVSSSSSSSNRSFSLPLPMSLSLASSNSFFSLSKRCASKICSSSLKTAVAATNSNQLGADKEQATKYYFVVANAKFMLDEEEHFKELLFERLRNYGERNKEQDFWLIIEPKFLDKFPNLIQRLRRPAVALVSTNGPWITFMKLRLDRVLSDNYEADSLEEALASNPATLDFEKPERWLAPYPKYEFGWWEPFLPTVLKELKV